MNRTEWRFEYTGARLAEAAAARRDERLAKLEKWTATKADVMEKIKASGIEVDEGLAPSHSNTSYRSPRVVIDTALAEQLQECHGKIQSHKQAADGYDGWHQILAANPEKSLALDHDDWLYFFLS